ncbi:hypothetical protein ACF0H5_002817 [Mactra antiquata]
MVTFSLVVSIHYLFTSDSEQLKWFEENGTLNDGYICALSKSKPKSYVVSVFHVADVVMHALCVGFWIVFYTLIVRELIMTRHRLAAYSKNRCTKSNANHISENKERPRQAISHISGNGNNTIYAETRMCEKHENVGTKVTPAALEISPSCHSNHDVDQRHCHNRLPFKLSALERRISMMAFVITVASFSCFVPYYISMTNKPNLSGTGLVYTAGVMAARRSYILNSAINPFIILYFNTHFRQDIADRMRRGLFFSRKNNE